MKPSEIIIAILTYGDRWEYLSQTIRSGRMLSNNVIYVFLNNVPQTVFEKITKIEKVEVINSRENIGSAGGYNSLIQYIASKQKDKYVLLLDDDNLLPYNSKELLSKLIPSPNTLYLINRIDRPLLRKAKEKKEPCLHIGSMNSFLGRNVFNFFFKQYEHDFLGDLIVAPYGGLLLCPSVLTKRLLPNKYFFLYGDDYEYTYRLVMRYNYKIILLDNISIIDLEPSFHVRKKILSIFSNRYSSSNLVQLFYSVRNQLIFESLRSNNKFIFYLNVTFVSIFFSMLFLLRLDVKRLSVFIKAVFKGIKDKVLFSSSY